MKILLTADVHLNDKYPERLKNFDNLVKYFIKQDINTFIIAGDLFDQNYQGYINFDNLAKKHNQALFYIIPGNHDSDLNQGFFTCNNIRIFSQPTIERIDNNEILFMPYTQGRTMGEVLEESELISKLKKNQWYLVSHGNWGGIRLKDSGNEGGYFPLTKTDLINYQPEKVFLGHLHKPSAFTQKVYYPGSPYPLDVNETGPRSVVLFDTKTKKIQDQYIPQTPWNLHLDLFIVPNQKEEENLIQQIEEQVHKIRQIYPEKDCPINQVRVRIKLTGYTAWGRDLIMHTVKGQITKQGLNLADIDASLLKVAQDTNLATLAYQVKQKIDTLKLETQHELKEELLKKALSIIYGG